MCFLHLPPGRAAGIVLKEGLSMAEEAIMSKKGAMGSVARKSNAESGSKAALTARMKGTSTANDMAVGTTV